jgi:thiol-disulfide isomerase/thioredoxin
MISPPRRLLAWAAALLAGAAALAAPGAPSVEPIDAAGLAARVRSLHGRPVVVNMWATWCEPCREEFPVFVALDRELRSRGLAMLSVSLDASSSLDKDVRPFLASQGATFPCFVKAPGDDDAFINAVDPAWSGSLPATFVYDPAGRRIHSIFEPVTVESLRGRVLPLLPKAAPSPDRDRGSSSR